MSGAKRKARPKAVKPTKAWAIYRSDGWPDEVLTPPRMTREVADWIASGKFREYRLIRVEIRPLAPKRRARKGMK